MTTIISLDLEANGLHGQIFALGATIHEDGREVDFVQCRCPIVGDVDPWVAENVLPALADMATLDEDYPTLLAHWSEIFAFYAKPLVIAHVAWPIEARFLWDAHRDEPFSGPFPLIDVASMLHQAGEDPLSVDGYLRKHGIPLPAGSPHHPLYDCRAAVRAYFALTAGTS